MQAKGPNLFYLHLDSPHSIYPHSLQVDDTLIKYLDSPCKAPGWSEPWRSDTPAEFCEEAPDQTDASLSVLREQAATISPGEWCCVVQGLGLYNQVHTSGIYLVSKNLNK